MSSCIFYFVNLNDYPDFFDEWWLDKHSKNIPSSKEIIYLYSFFWSLGSLSTIGGTSPNQPNEVFYSLFVMIFATIIFGYTIN